MRIKHKISFKLRAYGKKVTSFQIQMHVTFNCQRLVVSTGCQLSSLESWDNKTQLVCQGYIGPKGETDISINTELRRLRDEMETVFKYFEVNDVSPSVKQVLDKYMERLNGTKPKATEQTLRKNTEPKFFEVFQLFVSECGDKNAWTKATFEKMTALKEDLTTFNKNVGFSDLTESGLTAFVKYLREEKILKTPRKKKGDREDYDQEDIIGLKNSTIQKKLEYLSWFMNWATEQGYNTNMAYKKFRPALKTTQRRVIYLDKKELAQLKSFNIPQDKGYLENVRDVFLFCCFSGIRHSDVFNLKRSDIKDNHFEITTVKTADSISIELNSVTREILDKYKEFTFPEDKALPVISNQPMNRDLKELCRLAGINEQVRVTTYKGNQRKDEIKQKWELIGTHTGRRTFIVNCLSLGIAPNVVMKWTGHADYKSMKPYIDIVDAIKVSEMTKLDCLI